MRKIKKYDMGGGIDIASILLSNLVRNQAGNPGEYTSPGTYGIGNAIQGAGTGAAIGSAIMPGIGTAVGALGGGILSYLKGRKQAQQMNTEVSQAQRIEAEKRKELEKMEDGMKLRNYPTRGVERVSSYAMGGELLPVSKNVVEAKGDTHEKDSDRDGNTGILLTSQGQPIAEVENKEVIYGTKVFSNRLRLPNGVSFAEIAKKIAGTSEYNEAVRVEEKSQPVLDDVRADIFKKGTAERNMQKRPNPLNLLFDMQEAMKQQMELENIEQMRYGGRIPKAENGLDLLDILNKKTKGINLGGGLDAIAPFLDNIVNQNLTNQAPQIPVFTNRVRPILKTDFNINPQLIDIDSAIGATNQSIQDMTGSSSIARSNIIANNIQGIRERNKLYGQKENVETELKNQQASLDAQNINENAALLDNYRLQRFQRADDIRREKSANVANLTEDLRTREQDRNAAKLDKQKLALVAAQYMQSGVLDRSGFEGAVKIIDKGGTLSEALKYIREIKDRKNLEVPDKIQSGTGIQPIESNRRFRGINLDALLKGLI